MVPNHDCATAVLSFGNDALEVRVVDWMVFYLYGEMFLSLGPRQALRHRPRFQDTLHFQPEIVMQAAGIMFLDNEM